MYVGVCMYACMCKCVRAHALAFCVNSFSCFHRSYVPFLSSVVELLALRGLHGHGVATRLRASVRGRVPTGAVARVAQQHPHHTLRGFQDLLHQTGGAICRNVGWWVEGLVL